MTIPVSRQSRWLTILALLAIVSLLILGSCAANEPPVISDLTISAGDEITPGASCSVHCVATDLNEDKLGYSWSADGGSFSGSGTSVTWTAPDETGIYTITVEVTDGREGIATEQLIVNVLTPNNPPVIESVTRDWTNMKLAKATSTSITCAATDPDGDTLTYSWLATDDEGNSAGTFSGEGAIVSWLAPNEYGQFTITVTVSDARGGEATDFIHIEVCSCGNAQNA